MGLDNGEFYEYLLVVSPDWRVNLQIAKVQQHFTRHYGCRFANQLKPHIVLVSFVQHLSAEKYIIKHFERFTRTVTPRIIETGTFASTPPHCISAGLKDPGPLTEIITDLRMKYEKQLKIPGAVKPVFAGAPHIIIADNLPEEQFEQAWNDWQEASLDCSFKAKEMLLMRREQGVSTNGYQLIKSFPFAATSYSRHTQLTLFHS